MAICKKQHPLFDVVGIHAKYFTDFNQGSTHVGIGFRHDEGEPSTNVFFFGSSDKGFVQNGSHTITKGKNGELILWTEKIEKKMKGLLYMIQFVINCHRARCINNADQMNGNTIRRFECGDLDASPIGLTLNGIGVNVHCMLPF